MRKITFLRGIIPSQESRMRITFEITEERWAKLLELAALSNETPSALVREALDVYIEAQSGVGAMRRRALALAGSLSAAETQSLREATTAMRESW
jgi:hypothetical protein